MTQNEKELLLKDICARLPYGVKVQIPDEYGGYTSVIESIDIDGFIKDSEGTQIEIENIKPYLFPLSSMTEEQKEEYNRRKYLVPVCHYEYGDVVEEYELWDSPWSSDYLIENHFDCNDLIPQGLAKDATNLNIY
jgi:hypothetical protein